ncbi:hypothetical protein SRHO_G00329170 [Serrasalmus rhombeus]
MRIGLSSPNLLQVIREESPTMERPAFIASGCLGEIPFYFKPVEALESVMSDRAPSPTPSTLSTASDRSRGNPPNFNKQEKNMDLREQNLELREKKLSSGNYSRGIKTPTTGLDTKTESIFNEDNDDDLYG